MTAQHKRSLTIKSSILQILVATKVHAVYQACFDSFSDRLFQTSRTLLGYLQNSIHVSDFSNNRACSIEGALTQQKDEPFLQCNSTHLSVPDPIATTTRSPFSCPFALKTAVRSTIRFPAVSSRRSRRAFDGESDSPLLNINVLRRKQNSVSGSSS